MNVDMFGEENMATGDQALPTMAPEQEELI